MVKHRCRESIKSLFGSHVDPNKEEQLQVAKAEIEDKVRRILKLIKDDNLEEDSTPVKLSEKESLVELIEDFHNQYQALYVQYDHLTGELRKRIKGKREKGGSSSSSDSDSDYSSKDKGNKNGQLENEFQQTIDGLKQELEVVKIEVTELNQKVTITHEEKEDLDSKYLTALSKIQEADKINMDLKSDTEALGTQRSKFLVENAELNKQLDIASEIKDELSENLEDLTTEKDSLTVEKETALQQIEEEKKITDGVRTLVDQLKDETLALGKELDAVTGERSILKQQLERTEQQMTDISHNLKVAMEENESLKVKLSQTSDEVHLAHNRIQEFVVESSQIKEKLDESGMEIAAFTQMHEGYQKESSNQISELEAQVTNLELELESLQNQKRDMEEEVKSSTTKARELGEHSSGLQNQISELEMKSREREEELSGMMKKLEDNENESSSKMLELASQINKLLADIDTLHAQKDELEEQIICKSNEASTQVESITKEVNMLQQEVESLQHQKYNLEIQLVEKIEENSKYVIQVQTLEEEIDRKFLEQERFLGERENLAMQLRTLKLEMNTVKDKNSEAEEQLKAKGLEISHMSQGMLELHDKIAEIQKISTERESDFIVLQDKFINAEQAVSGKIKAFNEQIKNLEHDLASLQKKKNELEQQCEELKLEVDSVQNQKIEIEEQMKAKDNENSGLREEHLGLQGIITVLEKTVVEKKAELCTLQDKLHEKESEVSDQIAAFKVQIDNLKYELMSLQNKKQELEHHCEMLKKELDFAHTKKSEVVEQMRAKYRENTELREEILGLQGTITEQERTLAEKEAEQSTLHEKLHKKESEASGQITAFMVQINNLKHDLMSLQKEKLELEQQCEKLKIELDSTHNQKGEVEEQMRAKDHDNIKLRENVLELQGTITMLEKTLTEKEAELSTLQGMLHEKESEASGQINVFTVQSDNLKHDLVSLQNEKQELGQQCEMLKMELDSTHNQKGEVEQQLKAKSHENTKQREEILELQGTITVLERTLAEKESELSILQEKLHEKECEASSQITAFTVKIDNLKHDLVSLQNEKQELEQQCEMLKMELDSAHNQKGEVEEQMKAEGHENTELREKILGLQGTITVLEITLGEKESELSILKEKLYEKESETSGQVNVFAVQIDSLKHDLESLQNEKRELEQQDEKLKTELESTYNQKVEVEEHVRAKDNENTKLREEILGLQGTITALEKTLDEKESQLSTLQEKLHEKESEVSGQIISFTAQFGNLQKDLVSLQKTKEELELQCVKISDEHAERLVIVENEKNDISSKTRDLNRLLEEREDSYQKLNEEYKRIDSLFKECTIKREVAEKKIQEMAGKFHEAIESKDQMIADLEHTVEDLKRDLEEKRNEIRTLLENVRMLEVKLRLSNQKLRVTEQLLSEKEESFRKTEEKFQQDQRALEDRITGMLAIIAANNEGFDEIVSNIRERVNSVMTGIDFVRWKVSDECKNYENSISNISHEVEVAKDRVKEMNKEKGQLKREKRHLLEQLQVKNEEEFALRKSVEKLEAKASKEESEKINLTTTVVQLKKTVGELEKMMKEKEDGILDLGEEKREVIRQLCLWIDYHRSRYDYLKDILSKTRRGQRPA